MAKMTTTHDLVNCEIDIKSNGYRIWSCQEFKILSVYFHQHLTWNSHTNNFWDLSLRRSDLWSNSRDL